METCLTSLPLSVSMEAALMTMEFTIFNFNMPNNSSLWDSIN